jgi:hypothetical protein
MRLYHKFFYKGFFIFFCLLFQNYGFTQNRTFKYKTVNVNSGAIVNNSALLTAKKAAINIEAYLPKGYSKLGDVNYTDYLQKAINENKVLLMPNFPILIDWRGLNLRSNMTLIFQTKSKLIMKPNDKSNYHILGFQNINNVKVFGPNIQGDREKHANVKGEWGHGIKIFGSKAIKIYNANITDCWGDGIYVGRGAEPYSEDIEIIGGYIDNSRRNGISIISCKNLLVKNVIISNTNGTLPMAAIDLEPNSPEEELRNLNIQNVKTINNGYSGILIALQQLRNKEVLININGHQDDGALYYPLNIYGILKGDVDSWGVKGEINYSNSYWSNTNYLQFIHEGGSHNKLLKLNLSNNYFNNKGVKQKLNKEKLNISKINVSIR